MKKPGLMYGLAIAVLSIELLSGCSTEEKNANQKPSVSAPMETNKALDKAQPIAEQKPPTMTVLDICYESCDLAIACGFAPSGEDIREGCRAGCSKGTPRDCLNEAEMVTAWQGCSKACDQLKLCNPPACQHKHPPRASAHDECVRRLIAHSIEQIRARGGEPDRKEVASTADFTCGAAKDQWTRALEIYRSLNAMATGSL